MSKTAVSRVPQPARRSAFRRLLPLVLLVPILASTAGCQSTTPAHAGSGGGHSGGDPNAPTNIAISPRVLRYNVKRLGMNLSGQSFYDSGQMLRDLTFRNPGFEGQEWQTILQCKFVKGDSCADTDEWSAWPVDFAKGGTFEFFWGAAKGQSGRVVGSSLAFSSAHQGVWVNFGNLAVHPQVNDFYILRMRMPGNAAASWRLSKDPGATVTDELTDISRSSPGKQALRLTAIAPMQSAGITSDVDTWEGRSFVQLKGEYTLSFKAKGVGGSNKLDASVVRLTKSRGTATYLSKSVSLSSQWQDYKLPFTAHEDGSFIGPIAVALSVRGSSAILDDVSLTEAAAPDNPTAFRNAVVQRLRELQPGILRYMDNGTSFGSSIDNLIAPPYARLRSGYSEGGHEQLDIPIGLHEFLGLCKAVGADPWFSMPAGMSPEEMKHLMDYLGGPPTSQYGMKRAALGQSQPWTQVFSTIHLELGNETWNGGSFPGEGIPEPKAYASRVGEIFGNARIAPFYDSNKYDLIMGGWFGVPWWSEQQLSVKSFADTIDIAPYTFNPFNDASSTEAIFGPMFAEPEALDSRPTGLVAQQAKVAAKAGVKLAVYEVNLGTTQGKANQALVDSTIPSLGAGLSVVEHMLLMIRDNGITSQALFSLPEYANGFDNSDAPGTHELTKLWGSVVDMGGQSNRSRPTLLAEELANTAIGDKMLDTEITGANPTWDQPESANAKIKLSGAHLIQSFVFTDGKQCKIVVFNLSRTARLPVTFTGQVAPYGNVKVSRLTSTNITDTNEEEQKVSITHETARNFDPAAPYQLPPYSMTVLAWDAAGIK